MNIDRKDILWESFRSAAMGCHTKLDSWIRGTHMPTGIALECNDTNSRERNRAIVLERLEQKLKELA